MINFSTLQALTIPEGVVIQIADESENIIWSSVSFYYVSLGDSIAAGQRIRDEERLVPPQCFTWQYGTTGVASTEIISESYTDLIHKELIKSYGRGKVSVKSFARSGDAVEDLIKKLSHETVKKALQKANLVTICIGANDILGVVSEDRVWEYVGSGDLTAVESEMEANLAVLNNDANPNSYYALFNKLNSINPNAQYVFTTVYNPYKYLWVDEGRNGFFKPLLDTIPDINILGFDVDALIKDSLLSTDIVKLVFDRMNGLGDWLEYYINKLNQILRSKLNTYKATNPNFSIAETKTLFDVVPDRPIPAEKHYNDLVSVEYTKGYDSSAMGWGQLYEGTTPLAFWINLATKYVSTSGLDINGLANELMPQILEKVFLPDMDPHPEEYGQYALKRSFTDILNLESLNRYTISFNANGGSGFMTNQAVVGVDGLPAFVNIDTLVFTPPTTGYYFAGWNTKADGSGISYADKQLIGINSDITLYAQWSNIYTVTFRHSYDATGFDSSHTGTQENYALWIDGVEQADLGAFSNPPRVYELPYGTPIGVIAQVNSGDARSYVTWNGTTVAGKSNDARYQFNLTSDVDINFEWNYWLDIVFPQNYWNCYITTNEPSNTIKEMVLDSGVLDSAILA